MAYCEACGGWDKQQGGVGHRLGCPVGKPGTEINQSNHLLVPTSPDGLPMYEWTPKFKKTRCAAVRLLDPPLRLLLVSGGIARVLDSGAGVHADVPVDAIRRMSTLDIIFPR